MVDEQRLDAVRQSERMLYFTACGSGGIADYSHEQASYLVGQGVDVTLLCPPLFAREREAVRYSTLEHLVDRPARKRTLPRILTRVETAYLIIRNMHTLHRTIVAGKFDRVLLGSYMEYLAPLWAGRLRSLAASGVVFGAVVHDPVRDHVVGPSWWHRRSVAAGYSFLRDAFVHDDISLDTVSPMPSLRVTVVPHGPRLFPNPRTERQEMRRRLRIPNGAKVFLAFGQIRDQKNLHLMLEAIVSHPQVFLVVAGTEVSRGHNSIKHYRELAAALGVAGRCVWLSEYLPMTDVADLFSAADFIVITYSNRFRSASGVLGLAANYRRMCIASSGMCNLRTMVMRYDLGVWVEPDSLLALVQGIQTLIEVPRIPRWDDYAAENSWERNATLVRDRMFAD